jgi:hypothetical protein
MAETDCNCPIPSVSWFSYKGASMELGPNWNSPPGTDWNHILLL